MLMLSLLSLCEISMRPNEVRTFSRLLAQQLKLLARVHKSISLLLVYCTLCHFAEHHLAAPLSFRTCRPGVSRQSSTGWFRPVEALLFFASVFTHVNPLESNSKKGHQRSLFEPHGLNEPVRCILQITAAPPTTRR